MRFSRLAMLVVCAVACGGSPVELSLDARKEIDWTERRRLMNVRVGSPQEPGVYDDVTPVDFAAEVQADCYQSIQNEGAYGQECTDGNLLDGNNSAYITSGVAPADPWFGSTCRASACVARLRLCTAQRLMEIAETPDLSTVGQYQVPPQASPARTGLAELAAAIATEAAIVAGDSLLAAVGSSVADSSTCSTVPEIAGNYSETLATDPDTLEALSAGEVLAGALVEASSLNREAIDRAVQGNLAAADRTMAEERSESRARTTAYVAPVLSRFHAAQLRVGGATARSVLDSADPTGNSTIALLAPPLAATPIVRVDDRDPDVRAAYEVLRESGLDPQLVPDPTIDTDTLMAGVLPSGSVRERLEDLYQTALGATAADFYASFGLERRHFHAARQRMAEEVLIFNRAPIEAARRAVVDELGSRLEVYPRYAATSTYPEELPPSYWATVARSGLPSELPTVPQVGTLDPSYARHSGAATEDYIVSVAAIALEQAGSLQAGNGDANSPTNLLARLVMQGEETRPYRLESATTGSMVDFFVYGNDLSTAGVILVKGAAGLSCAAKGHVEGQPCNLDDYTIPPQYTGTASLAATGFTEQHVYYLESHLGSWASTEEDLAELNPDGFTVYLIRPDDPSGGAEAGAGEPECGLVVPPLYAAATEVRWIPCDPEGEEGADTVPQPNRDGTAPALSCTNLDDDARLPLENELSEDGDAFESSWRGYLERARRAADEADLLGEELIREGRGIDERAEVATANLERLCGSAIDLDPLGDLFPSDAIRVGPCGAGGTCTEGFCHSGHCLRDPVQALLASPEEDDTDGMRRLRECLSPEGIVPLVAMGIDPDADPLGNAVCVWRHPTRRNEICAPGESAGTISCPTHCSAIADMTLPTGTAADGLTTYTATEAVPIYDDGMGSTQYEVVEVADYLGLFAPIQPPLSADITNLGAELCDPIRQVINTGLGTPVGDAAFEQIRNDRLFTRGAMQEAAGRIRFHQKPGGYFDLLLGDLFFTTGNMFEGPRDASSSMTGRRNWPCGEAAFAGAANYGAQSLFAQTIDCTDAAERVRFANDVGAAVVAIKTLTNTPLTGNTFAGPQALQFKNGAPWYETCALAGDGSYGDPARPYRAYSCTEIQQPGGEASHGDSWWNSSRSGYSRDNDDHNVTFHCLLDSHLYGGGSGPSGCGDQNTTATLSDSAFEIWPQAQVGRQFGCYDDRDADTYDWAPNGWACVPFSDPGSFAEWRPEAEERLASIWEMFVGHPDVIDTQPEGVLYTVWDALQGRPMRRDDALARSTTDYWAELNRQAGSGTRFGSEFDVAHHGMEREHILGALDFLCEAHVERSTASGPASPTDACPPPIAVSSTAQIPVYRSYLRCVANQIRKSAETTVLANVPARVVEVLSTPGGIGAYPAVGGIYGEHVTGARAAILELPGLKRALASSLENIEGAIETLEAQLDRISSERAQVGLQLMSTLANQMTSCVQASASGNWQNPGSYAAGAAVCSNAIVQSAIAVKMKTLQEDSIDANEEILWSDLNAQLRSESEAMMTVGDAIRQAQERIAGGLVGLESTRAQAAREVARALLAHSDESGRVQRTNTVSRRRYNTLNARYQRARNYAIQMVGLAQLAVEQRLGIDLESTDWDPSLVDEPPARLGSLCESAALDYGRLRDAGIDIESFEDAYLGDYVRWLEGVVESYRVDFPFSDGIDTAVVSLKDDVQPTLDSCDVEGPNLLLHSSVMPSPGEVGWQVIDCAPETGAAGDCVNARLLPDGPVEHWLPPGEPPLMHLVTTGAVSSGAVPHQVDGTGVTITGASTETSARWDVGVKESRLAQQVVVAPGTMFRLSWYARKPTDFSMMGGPAEGPEPGAALEVIDIDTGTVVPAEYWSSSDELFPEYTRGYLFFDTYGETTEHSFEIRVVTKLNTSDQLLSQAIEVGGVMLEDVGAQVRGADPYALAGLTMAAGGGELAAVPSDLTYFNPLHYEPGTYVATRDSTTIRGPYCEDVDGDTYRAERWTWVCEPECLGVGSACRPGDPGFSRQCYWETSFHIDYESIADGTDLGGTGFARGNYNYRWDRVAVNFVGSGIHDCAGLEVGASECYGRGYLPFSLTHSGDYQVLDRNGSADTYSAPLFTGRIVNGRGLASERYLTNPLSGADRALIEPYSHAELRGRPIAGTYTLRVREMPGVRFDKIEDVQLLFGYRYWTRLD